MKVAAESKRFPVELIFDGDHYERVVQALIMERGHHSIWIATATVKDTRVEEGVAVYSPLLKRLGTLAGAGADIRVLHGSQPSAPFLASFARFGKGVRLRRNDRVHSKIVLVDGHLAYLGSANFTGAGLGAKSPGRRNHEAGVLSGDLDFALRVRTYFEEIWGVSGRDTPQPCLRR
ncbi:MAG: phospholipase D family protein [Opitutales bacterium]|nr:phospholipase D family protein [Opitutales bacterium]